MPATRSSITPDVIVVGAGPAGCVVAANLAAAGVAVEMIEAGPAADLRAAARSADWLPIQQDPSRRWPNLAVDRDGGGPDAYVIGRGVGGGSAINGMVVSSDHGDSQANWFGDVTIPGFAEASARIAQRWPTIAPSPGPFGARLIEAASSDGWTAGPVQLSAVMSGDGTIERRLLAEHLGAVHIVTDTTVRRCLVDRSRGGAGGTVTGVELADGTIRSAGHVVLCAGAIHTPAILLRSGIGASSGDGGFGGASAVGRGLADHPSRVITVDLGPELQSPPGEWAPIASSLRPVLDDARVEVLVMDHTGASPEGRGRGVVMVMLMDPVSTGLIELAGSSGDSLVVELGLLADPDDRRRLDDAVEQTRHLLAETLGGPGDLQPGFGPVSHVAASCRFGSAVGEAGDVNGFSGVGVMDAAALPRLPTVHPMVPTMALAEAFSAEWLTRSGIGNHPSP